MNLDPTQLDKLIKRVNYCTSDDDTEMELARLQGVVYDLLELLKHAVEKK